MNGLTQLDRSGDQRPLAMTDRAGRWRAWAGAIVGSFPTGRSGITRRRAPVKLALRRSRLIASIMQRNIFLHQFAKNNWIVVKPVLCLSLHWARTTASFNRTLAWTTPAETSLGMTETVQRAVPAATLDLIHRWSLREQRTQSRSLLREILERTRRLEERTRLEKRLVVRGAAASSVASSEQEDAARRAGPDWWKPGTPMHSPYAAQALTVDVDQVTETVMRRIDQRVSAWRERTGRR